MLNGDERSSINTSQIKTVPRNMYIKERNHMNIKLVVLTLYHKKTNKNMFRRFMKAKRILNVASIVIRDLGKKLT